MDNNTLFFLIFNLNGQFWLLDQLMIFASTSLIYLTFLFTLFLGLKGDIKDKKAFLLIIIGLHVAVLLIKLIHLFYFEPRPWVSFNFIPLTDHSPDASFPSRHATISSVIAFSYMYFKSKWLLLFLFIAVWIGLSRVFVGVHYPLDILGGFVVAAFSILISLQIKNLLKVFLLR